MRGVVAHDNQDTLSVVRATAIALGLPLLVVEGVEGLDPLEGHEQPDIASAAALVLVVRRPRQATRLLAPPRLAVARGADVAIQSTALPSSRGTSWEGGIVRFNLGSGDRGPVENRHVFADGALATESDEPNSSPQTAHGRPEVRVGKE